MNPGEQRRTSYATISYEIVKREPVITIDTTDRNFSVVAAAYAMSIANPTFVLASEVEASSMFARVERNPAILSGIPVIKGTRTPVSMILACFADGYSRKEILKEFPRLSDDDITEALLYASNLTERVGPDNGTHGVHPSR